MSKDKSKLKPLLRQRPFVDAIELVTEAASYSQASTIRTIFDDAPIRSSSITSKLTGSQACERFAEAFDAGFHDFPHVHTYVMCFDSKAFVPDRKASTQIGRREKLAEAIERKGVPEWQWDGTSAIIESASHAPLPPWQRVRLDSQAYQRALEDIVLELLATYCPPPGRRVILDSSSGVRVLETTYNGLVCEPYDDGCPKPAIGEADIAAQHYALRAFANDAYNAHVDIALRSHRERLPEHEHYRRNADEPVAPVTPVFDRRTMYRAGDVLLRSTDTDFLPLGLVVDACLRPSSVRHRVHVLLGPVHLKPESDDYCTGTLEGARRHCEFYDMRRLAGAAHVFHGKAAMGGTKDEARLHAIWSFVALVAVCGNDYVRRVKGRSHTSLFVAYRTMIDERRSLVSRSRRVNGMLLPIVSPSNFRSLVGSCELLSYYESVLWSMLYSTTAVYGLEHIPECAMKRKRDDDTDADAAAAGDANARGETAASPS